MTDSIKEVSAVEVLDSRGNPTVKAVVKTDSCITAAIVPSGASTGKHEAIELRDKNKRYQGKGVRKAVSNVNKKIEPLLKGKNCIDQKNIDHAMLELDGTPNKSSLGANAILAVSMAVCKAGAVHSKKSLYEHIHQLAKAKKVGLPIPQLNIINSGKHAGVDNDIQEHMILPTNFKSFSEGLRAGVETYHQLKRILKKKFGAQGTLLGDEGGFAPPIKKVEQRLDLVMKAVKEAGYEGKIKLGLDAAASEFFSKKKYTLISKKFSAEELVDFYASLSKKYPIITIEDGMSEDDWEGWQLLNKKLGSKVQLVGDDLLVTNKNRITQAIQKNACNALLLKVNQIGTVTESLESAALATKQKWNVVVSHRSGETEDDFIADLVVGLGASQSKFGAPARSDRNAKYNQLLHIEHELGKKAVFQKF